METPTTTPHWCMECFQKALDAYNADGHSPFHIYCTRHADIARRECDQCWVRLDGSSAPCNRPLPGTWGDAVDLIVFLRWTFRFWARDEDWIWDFSTRQAIGQASKNLAEAFKDAEQLHRIYHNLRQTDIDRPVTSLDARLVGQYSHLIQSRIMSRIPGPGYSYSLLYLENEPGLIHWNEAKWEFYRAIRAHFVDTMSSAGLMELDTTYPRLFH